MSVRNAYKITLLIEEYLEGAGTMAKLQKVLGYKKAKSVEALIKNQSWSAKHVEKLTASHIISLEIRKVARKNLNRSSEITRQVTEWIDELGSVKKLCVVLGLRSQTSYFNRVENHNWTQREVALLINKRILDDSF